MGAFIVAQLDSRSVRRPVLALPARGRANALWHGRSIRAQLLLIVVLIDVVAALLAGGVIIVRARISTRVEIAASMNLAEGLVGETIALMRQEPSPERLLATIPLQPRFLRHVHIEVTDATGAPVRAVPETEPARADERPQAPAWFAALIAPPPQRRELPIMAQDRRIGAVLIEGEPSDEIAEVWENALAFARVGLLLDLAMIGLLYVLFGGALRPLDGLARGLADLERRNYAVRLPRPRSRELAAITDRFNALAQALDAARADNAQLNRRLLTAQDDERRRTALDLHDEVGPCLFGLKAQATSIAKVAAELPDAAAQKVAERARELLAIVDRLQTINRGLLNRLRPMALGHVALGDLVAELVQERSRQHPEVAFGFSARALRRSYGDSTDLTVYRCVQEGMTNAVRHGRPRRVSITLGETPVADANGSAARLELVLRDDGGGIDPAAPRGFGLRGMQERTEALDGRFGIESAAGRGTTIRILLPVPPAGSEPDGGGP